MCYSQWHFQGIPNGIFSISVHPLSSKTKLGQTWASFRSPFHPKAAFPDFKFFHAVLPSIYPWPSLVYPLPWLLQTITSKRKYIQMTISYEPFCSDLLLTFPFVHKNTNKTESPLGIVQRFVPFLT